MENHPLLGRKQSKKHIKNRIKSLRRTFLLNPKPLKNIGLKLKTKTKVNKHGCWVWQGSRFKKECGNYAQIRLGRGKDSKCVRAHRVSYEYFIGKVPKGLELDHLCQNTLCINPKHLEPVTHLVNMRRRKDSGLPNCKYGHKYTKQTTYIRPDNGRRECILCRELRRK